MLFIRKTIMKKLYTPAWFCLAAILFSCTALPITRETPHEASPVITPGTPAEDRQDRGSPPGTPAERTRVSEGSPPERPVKPTVPEYIMGKGVLLSKDKAAFLLNANPRADRNFVEAYCYLPSGGGRGRGES